MGKAVTNRQEKVQSIVGVVGAVVLLRAFGFYSAEEAGQSTAVYFAAFAVPVAATALSFALAATGTIPRMPSALSRRIAIVTHRVTQFYNYLETRYRRKLA